MPRATLLEVRDVAVRFGGIVALDGVSFELQEGQILGLIGPNGAGKTTCFNLITRFIQPTSGRILYNGQDITAAAPEDVAITPIRLVAIARLMSTARTNVMKGTRNTPPPIPR